jgi:hypothetical protein
MKFAANRTPRNPLPGPVGLVLTLVCMFFWPTFLQAERIEVKSHMISHPPVISSEISGPVSTSLTGNNSNRLISVQQHQTERKSPLRDRSRDLSAFFYIGIGINVILALVFFWWFTREWRKTGHSRRSQNVD